MGHSLIQFSSWCENKILANIGPREGSMAAPSTWILNLLSNRLFGGQIQ